MGCVCVALQEWVDCRDSIVDACDVMYVCLLQG